VDRAHLAVPFRGSIPLNDEFLTAFGKREKEYDELMGRSVDIDKTSLDVVDVYDSGEEEGGQDTKSKSNVNYSAITTGKVRLTLQFTSSFAFKSHTNLHTLFLVQRSK
jgi:hypothetical protein